MQCSCSVHAVYDCTYTVKTVRLVGLCNVMCMVYCMGSVHSKYTAGTAVDLQCTLYYTAGTLHFGLGMVNTGTTLLHACSRLLRARPLSVIF